MRDSIARKRLRVLIIPLGALIGTMAAPILLIPSAAEMPIGERPDPSGAPIAMLLGLVLGVIAAYVIRTALDYTVWASSSDKDVDAAERP